MAPVPAATPPPLEGLRDIVLAPPAGLFPFAPGWYLIAAMAIGIVVWDVLRFRRRRAANLYRRQALAELDRLVDVLERKGGRYEVAARLPELLKQVALHVEPR